MGTGTQGRSPQEEVSSLLLKVSSRETGPSLGKNITHQSQRGLGFPLGGLGECPLRKPCPTWGGIKGVPTLAPGLNPHEQSSQAFSIFHWLFLLKDSPGGSVVKNPPASIGDTGSIFGLGRSPGGGNGNPLQHSCLGNPTDRGAWRATDYRVSKESGTT